MTTTTNLKLPLRWERYTDDRKLVEAAFIILDTKVQAALDGNPEGATQAADVEVTAPVTDATWTDVQAALDDIAARLAVLEP